MPEKDSPRYTQTTNKGTKDMNDKISIKLARQIFSTRFDADGMGWELSGDDMSAATLAVIAKHYLHENNITHVNINGEDIEVDSLFDNDILKEKVPYLHDEDFDDEDSDDDEE
jgi:hypothetical protein